jgi:hypothetical protein
MQLLQNVNSMKAFFLMLLFILTHSKHTLDLYDNMKCRYLQLQHVNIQPAPNTSTIIKMPSQYQYTPPGDLKQATRLTLARFRGFLNHMHFRAVLARRAQGDTEANAQQVVDSYLSRQQNNLDLAFGFFDGMFHLQAPIAARIQPVTETANIEWPTNGNANRNRASRQSQAPTDPNATPPNASCGTQPPADATAAQPPRPLPLRAWMDAHPNEPSASQETTVEYDPEHVTWGDTPTPTESGEIPIALGSAAAPPLRQAPHPLAVAPGAQPNPQHSSLLQAAHRMVAWENSEEGRAEIARRRLADDNARNPGRVNGFYDTLAEEEELSEGSPDVDQEPTPTEPAPAPTPDWNAARIPLDFNREVPAPRPQGLSINDLNALAGISINEPMKTPSDSGSVGFQSQIAPSPTEERETTAESEHDEVQSQVEDSPTEDRETADDSDHDELYE